MLYAIVAMLAIIADQWVKYWSSSAVPWETTGETFIPGLIDLVYVRNDGAAFGILSGGGARIYFIILAGVFAVAVILALATNFISDPLGRWSIVLMTAGGLSNCIDRVIYGYVQDMFKLTLFNFPVFNVADIFITVFCLLFVVSIIFGHRSSGYDDEFDEEDDEEEDRPRREKKVKEPKEAKPPKEKKGRKGKKAKYEDEYEQFKAARGPRPEPQPPQAQPVYDASDPFAEWEKANARAGNPPMQQPVRPTQPVQQQPVRPVQQPAQQPARPAQSAQQPVQQARPVQPAAQSARQPVRPAQPVQQQPARPAKPAPAPQSEPEKSGDMDFNLDDILAEFK